MTAHLLRTALLSWFIVAAAGTPTASADAEPPTATATAGERVAVSFVSDRRDNGPSSWFDALNRPRSQEHTILPEPVGSARLWTSTLVFTASGPVQRLTATFTTSGSFARCVIVVNDEMRDERTSLAAQGKVTCSR